MMVSIIVPIYNSENYIDRCLKSILGQTYEDLEIVLVNDGSTDRSKEILEQYAAKDERIKIVSQKNQGVAAARNTGLDNVTGDYILYVDSDDWIEKNMLERMIAAVEDDSDIAFCGFDQAKSQEEVTIAPVQVKYEVWDHNQQLLEFMKHKRMTGMLWNKLIKKNLTDGIQFDEQVGFGEDAQFLWQVLKRSKKMIVTNEVLYHHVMDENSISHLNFSDKKYSAIPMWEGINREVDKDYPELKKLARERLMCAAVFSMYEARGCRYQNATQIQHMRAVTRKNILGFVRSHNVSFKFKLYAIATCLGY